MRNGGIYHIPVHRLHAPVNHRMVQCVRLAAKIFTDFTSIDFGTAKSSRRCTAWYGKPAFCTLLYMRNYRKQKLQQSFGTAFQRTPSPLTAEGNTDNNTMDKMKGEKQV